MRLRLCCHTMLCFDVFQTNFVFKILISILHDLLFLFFFFLKFQMNGVVDPNPVVGTPTAQQKPIVDYKLLVDPFLVKAQNKLYRYNGVIPNDPNNHPILLKDPRNVKAIKLRTRVDPIELIVPRYLPKKINNSHINNLIRLQLKIMF